MIPTHDDAGLKASYRAPHMALIKSYHHIVDRFIDSGIPYHLQPKKIHEGPPYDVACIPYILDRIVEGHTLASILRDDPALPRMNEFIQYVRSDPKLYQQYLEAKEARAEVYTDKMVAAAEGVNEKGEEVMEDVQRSRLKVDTYKWLAGVSNRQLYGEKKQIDVNTRLDLSEAMEMAERRLAEKVIEGEVVDDDDPLMVLGIG